MATDTSLTDSTKVPVICVQGLGFVGAAVAAALASRKSKAGAPLFRVIGVDLNNQQGRARIAAINEGLFPFATEDPTLVAAIKEGHLVGNLSATDNQDVYAEADIVIVDVHLDVEENHPPTVDFTHFKEAIHILGSKIQEGTLVIIETTVPPGTTQRIVAPILTACARGRGLPEDAFLLAHAYERVMPGQHYLNSIINFWRVFAGYTPRAAIACRTFLSSFINIEEFPLTELPSTTASEIAKVMENSYRAVNIAFIEEWARFAEATAVDLYAVIDAIRIRPTHNNMRQPGFGVGGYCLTKDPFFAGIAARDLFKLSHLEFPFSEMAVETNNRMPLVSCATLAGLMGGFAGKRVLMLGITYRQDVADTRFSPAQIFAQAIKDEARITAHDPLVTYWPEMDMPVLNALPRADSIDGVIFCVPHQFYTQLDLSAWLREATPPPAILDANNVLSHAQRAAVVEAGCAFASIGRGQS